MLVLLVCTHENCSVIMALIWQVFTEILPSLSHEDSLSYVCLVSMLPLPGVRLIYSVGVRICSLKGALGMVGCRAC